MSTQTVTEKTTKRKTAVHNDESETTDLSEFTQKNHNLPAEMTQAEKELVEAAEAFVAALDKEAKRGVI